MRILVGLMALAGVQSGLDAPVTTAPTVRTEIRRGYDAAAACQNYQLPADSLDPCITRITTENRISHPTSTAFDVGINIRKWVAGADYASLPDGLPGNRLAERYAVYGKASAAEAELQVLKGVAELKITVDQAFAAAGTSRPKTPSTSP